jgi:hypothetical protein
VWHLKPAASDPDTVLAGVEDAALFRSVDGGQSWSELSGLREHGSGPRWQPGAGGMCLHSILPDPRDTDLMLVAISAAGVFRTDDGGKSWRASNRGLVSEGIPDPDAEVGHSVHKLARHPARPDPVYMQKHWDVMRSDDGGEHWVDIGGNLPTDFGFVVDVHAHEPEIVYVLPSPATPSTSHRRASCGCTAAAAVERVGAAHERAAAAELLRHVLRDAMAVDRLDECGVYFGTTGGQVYASPDGGDSWTALVRDLPAVLSVEVQRLP